LKEFYGKVSLTARVDFFVKAEDKEKAENVVFNDIKGIDIALVEESKLEISGVDWDLVSQARQGNVRQPYVDDFEIEEEKG
jgi:hypothetical protein